MSKLTLEDINERFSCLFRKGMDLMKADTEYDEKTIVDFFTDINTLSSKISDDDIENDYTYECIKNNLETLKDSITNRFQLLDPVKDPMFKSFLKVAKSSAYGAGVPETVDAITKRFKCVDSKYPGYTYIDTYYGAEVFTGIETISKNIAGEEKVIYALSYAGIEYKPFKNNSSILNCLCNALRASEKCEDAIRGVNGIQDNTSRWTYIVDYQYDNGYVSGTEFIILTDVYKDFVHNFKKDHSDVTPTSKILAHYCVSEIKSELFERKLRSGYNVANDFPDYVAFRCDFQGGLVRN